MEKKVFISGSIKIDQIPTKVISSLEKMKENNLTILVGDAEGIDSEVQNYFRNQHYFNVDIYTIYDTPRHRKSDKFNVKVIDVNEELSKERERQMKKDEAMTNDSDYSLVIWDGKSKGSYQNIIRSLEQGKQVRVFLSTIDDFITQDKVNVNEIKFIYDENNGYTATELLEQLNLLGVDSFKNTRELNKYLLEEKIIKKEDDIYLPVNENTDFFIIKYYKGKKTGLLFTNNFVNLLEKELKKDKHTQDGFAF